MLRKITINQHSGIREIFINTIVAAPLSIISIPILAATVIAIKIEDKGSIFYTQERLGSNGKKFNIYKIRSMKEEACEQPSVWAIENDPRITRVGKFIRKTRIDELPQLLNVLAGDMNIIGPRPEAEHLHNEILKTVPNFSKRLDIKPGLTGLAQVNGGYDLSPAEKLKLDIKYIQDRNVLIDLKILLKTCLIIFNNKGAR